MKQVFTIIAPAALAILLAGCGGDTLARPAIRAEIRDARSGAARAYGATLIARSDSYADTAYGGGKWGGSEEYNGEQLILHVAYNRAGIFDVRITHPGYEPWVAEGIRVTTSGSNPFDSSPLPKSVFLDVRLQPIE